MCAYFGTCAKKWNIIGMNKKKLKITKKTFAQNKNKNHAKNKQNGIKKEC